MFVDKDLESKIQDYLRLDQECSPEQDRGRKLYAKSCGKRPVLVTTTFSNSRGGRLRELRL